MLALNVVVHGALMLEYSAAEFARNELELTNTVNGSFVSFHMILMLECLGTDVTLKGQQVTNAMDGSQVRL